MNGANVRVRCCIKDFRGLSLLVATFARSAALVLVFPAVVLCAHSLHDDSSNIGPDALIREVIHNEIHAQIHDGSLWCFREERQEDGKPARTLDVCESTEGNVERLIAVNGRALDPSQQQAEDQRIQKLLSQPEQIRANQKKQREDGEQERNMLMPFPEAFRFQCERVAGDLVTLQFQPNPNFRPSSRTALVFHHMEGRMIVDARQKRIVEINGRLTSEVKFAGGLLGHLDRNGTFFVRQGEVAPGHWDLQMLNVHMSGKALFFKTISVLEKKTISDYRPLPQSTTLQQAVAKLQIDAPVRSASIAGK